MSTITVTNPIFDQVYKVQAWADNNRTLKLVQGEGIAIPTGATSVSASRVKAPRFQLCDKRGAIDLSTGSPTIEWAVTRPQNGGEDIVTCNIVSGQATNGIIEIPITASVTEFDGDAYGEIRVTTSGAVIKFFGINACIGEGVSDDAAAQSSRFSALLEALQKVVSVQAGNVAAMDTLNNGNLPNGTNPVASGQLKTFLENAYKDALKSDFMSFDYAHEVHSSSYDADTNPVDTYSDNGVYIDEAINIKKYYFVRNSSNTVYAILLCITVPGALYAYGATQVRITHYGAVSYRTSTIVDGKHTWNTPWYALESKRNIDTTTSNNPPEISNDDSHYPSSKLVRSKLAEKADKTTTVAGLSLSSNITVEALANALNLSNKVDKTQTVAGLPLSGNISADDLVSALMTNGKTIYYHVDTTSPFGSAKYLDVPVPTIWKANNNVYLVLSRTAGTPSPTYGTPYTYSGLQLTRYKSISSWDVFDPNSTSGVTGEIAVGGTVNGVWVCKGSTQWVRVATLSDLDNVKTKMATVILDASSWSNGEQAIDVSSVYTLTEDTKVDIEIDFDAFSTLQTSGCYGIYLETVSANDITRLNAKVMGSAPSSDVEVQLIFSEIDNLGEIGGGDN